MRKSHFGQLDRYFPREYRVLQRGQIIRELFTTSTVKAMSHATGGASRNTIAGCNEKRSERYDARTAIGNATTNKSKIFTMLFFAVFLCASH
jgi:hypothetical protein